jgi:hypothetical protein
VTEQAAVEQRSRFVFGRRSLRILARKSVILTEVSVVFLRSLVIFRGNATTDPSKSSSARHCSSVILPPDVILSRYSERRHVSHETNLLMVFRQIIAVYCENLAGYVNTLRGQSAYFLVGEPVVRITTNVLQKVRTKQEYLYNSDLSIQCVLWILASLMIVSRRRRLCSAIHLEMCTKCRYWDLYLTDHETGMSVHTTCNKLPPLFSMYTSVSCTLFRETRKRFSHDDVRAFSLDRSV